jgi:hypothetical protein
MTSFSSRGQDIQSSATKNRPRGLVYIKLVDGARLIFGGLACYATSSAEIKVKRDDIVIRERLRRIIVYRRASHWKAYWGLVRYYGKLLTFLLPMYCVSLIMKRRKCGQK